MPYPTYRSGRLSGGQAQRPRQKFGSGAARVSDGGYALSDLLVYTIVGRASAAPPPEVWFWSRPSVGWRLCLIRPTGLHDCRAGKRSAPARSLVLEPPECRMAALPYPTYWSARLSGGQAQRPRQKFGSGAARVSDGGYALSDLQVCAIVGRASAAPSPEVWFWGRPSVGWRLCLIRPTGLRDCRAGKRCALARSLVLEPPECRMAALPYPTYRSTRL